MLIHRCSECGPDPIVLHPETHRVAYRDKVVRLSPLQFDALQYMLRRHGRDVDADAMRDWMYQLRPAAGSHMGLQLTVSKLRRKMASIGIDIPPAVSRPHARNGWFVRDTKVAA